MYLIIILSFSVVFFTLERLFPGRELPHKHSWYLRAAFFNLCQLGVVLIAGYTWSIWLREYYFFSISNYMSPILVGFIGWFIGTFIFYWWHRIRHSSKWCWLVLHQIHHSPSRIETLTAFYKHPLEIVINSIVSTSIIFCLLGGTVEAIGWYNVFAAFGEMFYHSNIKTPHWVGYFLQRPEHHSIHHEYNVHNFNFGDITWWDRLFGTFRDVDQFAKVCGFRDGKEEKIVDMMLFKDVY